MEVLIQLPITDIRTLVTPDAGRRKRPTWPTAEINSKPGTGEFVSHFGELRKPDRTMADQWAGRSQCVSAKQALRLPDRFDDYYNKHLGTRKYYSEFLDRCYFGSAVSPRSLFEMRIRIRSLAGEKTHSWSDIDRIINATARIPVRVPTSSSIGTLTEVKSRLADFVRTNTTSNSFRGNVPSWLTTAGRPIVFLLLQKELHGSPPENWDRPSSARSLYYRRVDDTEAFVVQETDIRLGRRIALGLGRFHIERSVLMSLARHLVRSNAYYAIDPRQQELQNAIKSCADYINRDFAYGQDQELLREIFPIDLILHDAEWDSLRESFAALPEDVRRTAIPALGGLVGKEAIQLFMSKNIFVGNKEITVEHMGDYIHAEQGAVVVNRSHLKDALNKAATNSDSELSAAIEEIRDFLDGQGNKDAIDAYNRFLKEQAQTAPDKTTLKLFWEGVVKALPDVATLTSAVAKVVGLFA